MIKLTITQPHSDERLVWDSLTKKYKLNKGYILNLLGGNPYQDDGKLERRNLQNSRLIYSYILTRGNSMNQKYNEFILNSTQEGRDLLCDVLTSQIIADTETGYNDLIKQVPINFTNFTSVSRRTIIENSICVEAQMILENSQARLGGYNIMSQIRYSIPEIDREIEEYDTKSE